MTRAPRRPVPPTGSPPSFFTIGHSTRPIDEFVALIAESSVAIVVDVRTVPRSRTNPQYNKDTLPETLAQFKSAMSTLRSSVDYAGTNATWRRR